MIKIVPKWAIFYESSMPLNVRIIEYFEKAEFEFSSLYCIILLYDSERETDFGISDAYFLHRSTSSCGNTIPNSKSLEFRFSSNPKVVR